MSTKFYKLALCIAAFLLLTIPLSATMADTINANITVTVSDQNPFQTIYHTDGFMTVLQATVSGTPTPKAECNITSGPNYYWSSVSSPYQIFPAGSTARLTGTPQLPNGWTGPTNGTTVTVYVTWGDDQGNTYTTSPTSYTVHFTTRSPQNVVIQGHTVQRLGPGQTGDANKPYWGHAAVYVLQVMDNQQPYPQGYDRGTLVEAFTNTQLNPQYASNLQAQNAPSGSSDFSGGALGNSGYATDDNSWNNGGWTNPPTSDTGWQSLWFQTVQNLTVNEQLYGSACNTPVGYFTLYVEQGDTLRQ